VVFRPGFDPRIARLELWLGRALTARGWHSGLCTFFREYSVQSAYLRLTRRSLYTLHLLSRMSAGHAVAGALGSHRSRKRCGCSWRTLVRHAHSVVL